jgi:hypothetical protein
MNGAKDVREQGRIGRTRLERDQGLIESIQVLGAFDEELTAGYGIITARPRTHDFRRRMYSRTASSAISGSAARLRKISRER